MRVTLGFMMVPEADFMEFFTPTSIDTSFKTQVDVNEKKHKDGQRNHSYDIEIDLLENVTCNIVLIERHPAIVEHGFMTEDQ